MDKKTIIYGLVAMVAIAGIVWYAGQNEEVSEQMASLVGVKTQNEEQEKEGTSSDFQDLVMGSSEAPVTMIEYSSHFCGHCVNFHKSTFPLIVDKYVKTGKLKIIPRILGAQEMGKAVLCAEEQGNFSDFNEYLFEHISEAQSFDDVKKMAGQVGLNEQAFSECVDSEKYAEWVQSWYTQAQEIGITGTPTFLIGDQQIVGNQPYSVFELAIEAELAKVETD